MLEVHGALLHHLSLNYGCHNHQINIHQHQVWNVSSNPPNIAIRTVYNVYGTYQQYASDTWLYGTYSDT